MLLVGRVPGVLQSEVPGLRHQQFLVGRLALLPDLVPVDLVNGLAEMLNDVEFIEYQHRRGESCLDDIDVRLPHITADAFQLLGALFARLVEKAFSASLSGPSHAITSVGS